VTRNAPAYQMYADDFRVGSISMSLQERGAYITLLNHQWDAGHVPGDDIVLVARALSCDREEAEQVWPAVQQKFKRGSDGKWKNRRMEDRAGQAAEVP
jgi:uncharacterized protein YdaU (DUF1376 family)